MHYREMPSAEEFRDILHYDPETGLFSWARGRPGAREGAPAGSVTGAGYRQLSVLGGVWRGARVAWRMHTGEDPLDQEVDHIDRVRLNDRFANLRLVSRYINAHNTKHNAASGHRGVWRKNEKFWGARLSYMGKCVLYRQDFESLEEAISARIRAEESVGLR